jgi:hypothetical protein
MAKSITVNQNKKRGPGRPATGRDPAVAVRLPKDILAKVDEWAEANEASRSESIRALLERAFDAAAKPAKGRGAP